MTPAAFAPAAAGTAHAGVRLLSAQDVQAVLDPQSAVRAVDALWTAPAPAVRVPRRVTFDGEHGWFRVMPGALLGGLGPAVVGTKVIALARGAGISYLLLLYDEATAALLAIMDASALTQIRTGAVSAAFVRRVRPAGAPVVGVFGSGFEARSQLRVLAETVPVAAARVFSPNPERRRAFAAEMSAALGVRVDAVSDAAHASDAPIVLLATRSTTAVARGEWFAPGALVVSIGSTRPELRELDEAAFGRAAAVVVDHTDQTLAESGDVRAAIAAGAVREADLVDVADFLMRGASGASEAGEVGEAGGARSPSRLVIFKPSGTAAQDLAVARLVYDRCVAAKRGTVLGPFLAVKAR
jgi:ornithine cyclodeaminase/alanine dehydrogenase